MRIMKYPEDKVLRQVAKSVEKIDDDLRKLLDEMVPLMRKSDGVGLAAPQIGDSRRFFLIEYDDELVKVINPVITAKSKETECLEEGCLSLPNLSVKVCRPVEISVEFYDENGDLYEADLEGFLARVFLHEFDHLDGKLLVDHVDYSKL